MDAKPLQSCPTLWDSMDCSPSGSSVHGILQARILEWVAISFSTGAYMNINFHSSGINAPNIQLLCPKVSVCLALFSSVQSLSRVRLCVTPWTAAHQAPRPWESPGKNTGMGCHFLLQCVKVKSESEVPQSCLTLSDPMDCSLPGSSVHGIPQARVLEWGAIAVSEFPSLSNLIKR